MTPDEAQQQARHLIFAALLNGPYHRTTLKHHLIACGVPTEVTDKIGLAQKNMAEREGILVRVGVGAYDLASRREGEVIAHRTPGGNELVFHSRRMADRIDGYDRDDLGESADY